MTETTVADARAVLVALADQLADGPHYRIITEGERLGLILNEVSRQHGYGPLALNLDREVQLLAPTIGWEMTRGEYALILRRTAGGAE
ncbi:hypothetical protein [Streptomyces sp. 8L]|uniref:hypothetical protein n=1 Tax=Streptomyces sp. 8L TaxID=2877242 RepID=UPI001CD6C41B|nr:hypothetical protein [Streptomyces sp. 8L]MCA1218677.1 hypothetical protein [Streptomyces sp. 8L]